MIAVVAVLLVLDPPLFVCLPPLDEPPLDEPPRFPGVRYTKQIYEKVKRTGNMSGENEMGYKEEPTRSIHETGLGI